MREQTQPTGFYTLEDKSTVSREYLEKFARAQKNTIKYLVKTGQMNQDHADHLLRDRGEKTPEYYFEN